MGISCDYFAAASDEVAVTIAADGPFEHGLPAVALKGVDPVVAMGRLESVLTAVPYESIVDDPRHGVTVYEDDDVWVVALAPQLQEALARAAREDLLAAAAQWAAFAQLSIQDEEDLKALTDDLLDLAALARQTSADEWRLYCWVCP